MPEVKHRESLSSEQLLPLAGKKEPTWINQTHFFFRAAAIAMQYILIGRDRRRKLITSIIYEKEPYEANLHHGSIKTSDK